MKKALILGVLLFVTTMALAPPPGRAFNSATHIYIANWVHPFTFDKINLYYGSIAPDISLYVISPEDWPDSFWETHYDVIVLPYERWKPTQKAFAKGWQTHNEIWGADLYAHGRYPDYDGYVNIQAGRLADIFDVLSSPQGFELAHFAIEVAIDLLLVRYHDPSLGLKLLWAAKFRSPEDLNLLVEAFVGDGKLDLQTLLATESTFRDLVINYATALTLPDPLRMTALGQLGASLAAEMGVSMTPAEVRGILRVAMYLCKDSNYMETIQSAIKGIRMDLDLIR